MPDVYADVRAERQRQDAKWGEQDHDPTLWLAILTEEVGEVAKAVLEYDVTSMDDPEPLRSVRRELIQVAAVAIAAAQSMDRQAVQIEARYA